MDRLYRRPFLSQRGLQPDVLFLMNASLIKVSIRTIWSIVLLLALKPVCRFERRLFDASHKKIPQILLVIDL